ncbi:Uncharacterized protein FKW44_011883 [Caligus rogercresseyi]|uniref:Uncharacterized protein n=1 Tax=Caligus rogercresseyi TaxID=217165 RepID=A0A7T8HJU2_CALRO|nr:Uncharacterized protein FKW44_011883 [Caligus rogercresseyi]
MSSELERRTAIIVALRCSRASKEIIDFFKFPKATVYSIAKSFKESEDIEEGFRYGPRLGPYHWKNQGQNVNKEVYLDVMQTVVKPWMT